jgi:hypothetical protein
MTESDLLIKIHLKLTVANVLLLGEVPKPVVGEEDVILSHNIGFCAKTYLTAVSTCPEFQHS